MNRRPLKGQGGSSRRSTRVSPRTAAVATPLHVVIKTRMYDACVAPDMNQHHGRPPWGPSGPCCDSGIDERPREMKPTALCVFQARRAHSRALIALRVGGGSRPGSAAAVPVTRFHFPPCAHVARVFRGGVCMSAVRKRAARSARSLAIGGVLLCVGFARSVSVRPALILTRSYARCGEPRESVFPPSDPSSSRWQAV